MAGDLLKQGIAALNAGRKEEARRLLMQFVQQDERNEMGWLWLSGAVDADEDRRVCLENVLAINPNNAVARRGLESLIAKKGVRSLSTASPSRPSVEPTTSPREQSTQSRAESNVSEVIRNKKRKEILTRGRMTKRQTGLLIGLGAGVLVLVCIAFAGIWWVVNNEFPQLEPVTPISVDITQVPSITGATPTVILSPMRIPTWTPTPHPTNTPAPTRTPRPTNTPRPTQTPIVIPTVAVQKLGPIWDSLRDESYTVQISLNEVRFSSGGQFSQPKQGQIYVIVDATIKNLGPSPVRSIGPYDFQVRDANGALRDSSWHPDYDKCQMDIVDLAPNGSVSGCFGFEVPIDGKLELIYAPYQYEALESGRYLSFTIRR